MNEQAPRQNDLETQIKEKFAGYTDGQIMRRMEEFQEVQNALREGGL